MEKKLLTTLREQKTALFTDDVLMYLTHPTSSLPALMSLLKEFGLFSGYKLNVRKTQILTFDYVPDKKIRKSFRFNWGSKFMKYLGVVLCRLQTCCSNERIFSVNEVNGITSWTDSFVSQFS